MWIMFFEHVNSLFPFMWWKLFGENTSNYNTLDDIQQSGASAAVSRIFSFEVSWIVQRYFLKCVLTIRKPDQELSHSCDLIWSYVDLTKANV